MPQMNPKGRKHLTAMSAGITPSTKKTNHKITARVREAPVSIVPKRLSPIFIDISFAPGATPFFSGSSGKCAAAMQATWVP